VKVWLDDWDTSPWALEPLFSIDFNFYIDNSKLQLNSVTHNTMSHGGPFENGLISFFDYGGGVYGIGVANFTCASITDKLLIATIELEGIAPGDSTISAKFDFPEGNVTPGGSACALPHAENGVDTTATIHQSECVVDQDCWNFMWCDGIETCAGGLCVAGVPPCSDDLDNCTNDCVEGTPSVESNPGTCNVCNATGISDLCCSDNACLGEPVCTVSIKDYYVDGDNGSNLNDGLTPATAWKTITWALSQDNGTENNQIIIHVAASTYDTVMGGGDAETFPLVMKSYVSLKGAGYIGTIINANQTETLDGGVIFAEQANNFTIDGFTITGGVALLKGGGIHLSYSSPSISNCKISGNTATYLNGGGIYLKQSSPEITNCLITGNTAPNQNGGGISCGDHSSPVVTNCTIADNTASNGFGEGGGGISCGNGSSPPVKNCILWGNYPDQILEQDGTAPTFNYCCIQGGHSGTGIVTSDPNFIGSGDYHIFLGSSCIDAADSSNAPVADIDGKDRYNDTTTPDSGTGPVTFYDIGAYEYLGDADYDGVKDDGDGSGIADDNPCTGGQTQNCDDNCILSPNGPDLGTCTAGSIGSICVSNAECGAGGFCSMQQEDSESDGVGDVCDNCLDTPNGPILGTCSKTIGGLTLSIQEICAVDNDCDVSGYFCLLNQSDVNGNGIGNACECYSDLNGDGDVNSADLLIMKIDYTRTDCDITPCQADINGDGNVNSADLLIMKIEYNRNNCQQLP
jgi:parallel beta-helix repeat protein